jgi:hypothetical protein
LVVAVIPMALFFDRKGDPDDDDGDEDDDDDESFKTFF